MIQGEKKELGLMLYEKIFNDLFQEDNYMYNPEVTSEYVTLLVEEKEFFRAIRAKKKFIEFLKKQRKIDH